jgi:hypothetical protein
MQSAIHLAVGLFRKRVWEYLRAHFAVNTDSGQLISTKLAWRQREMTMDQAFPRLMDLIIGRSATRVAGRPGRAARGSSLKA